MRYDEISDHDQKEIGKFRLFLKGKMTSVEQRDKDYCKHVLPLKWYKLKDNTRLCENCHKEINPRWLK